MISSSNKSLIFTVALFALVALYSCQAITNTVELAGLRYATLDNASPTAAGAASQQAAVDLPVGWTVAANNTQSIAAAAANVWGTECLVLADGSVTSTAAGVSCGLAVSQLVTSGSGDSEEYRPVQSRVFISQPVTDTQHNAAGSVTASAATGLAVIAAAVMVFFVQAFGQ